MATTTPSVFTKLNVILTYRIKIGLEETASYCVFPIKFILFVIRRMADQVLLTYMQKHCKAVTCTITSHYESRPVANIDETYNPNVAEVNIFIHL